VIGLKINMTGKNSRNFTGVPVTFQQVSVGVPRISNRSHQLLGSFAENDHYKDTTRKASEL